MLCNKTLEHCNASVNVNFKACIHKKCISGSEEIIRQKVNKAKGRISKWVFQENKARQIFRKTNISCPLHNI